MVSTAQAIVDSSRVQTVGKTGDMVSSSTKDRLTVSLASSDDGHFCIASAI